MNKPGSFSFPTWLGNHPTDKIDAIIDAAIKGLREQHGIKRIGAVGYCFGGRYVARFLAEGKGLDAGFVAHPSLTKDDEWEAIRGPLSVAGAGKLGVSFFFFFNYLLFA
jgi:dienelactone hydrolase